jgi:hypothetical protein
VNFSREVLVAAIRAVQQGAAASDTVISEPMPTLIDSLWTPEQVVLTILLTLGALVLLWKAPRDQTSISASGGLDKKTLNWVVGLSLALAAAFLVYRGKTPVGIRMDSYSDANVIVSARNYIQVGLSKDWAAPQHQVVTVTNPPDPFYSYTKYPPLSNLIMGIYQVLGGESVRAFRLLPAACSLLAVWLWYGTYRSFAPTRVAGLAGVLMVSSYGFLAYADNLYFHGYAILLHAAMVRCFVRAMRGPQRTRVASLAACAVFLLLTALFTWEYHLWSAIFIGGYVLLNPIPVRRRTLLLLILPLVVAAALQTTHRRLSEAQAGSAKAPGPTLLDSLYIRTIGFKSSIDTPPGATLSNYPARLALSIYRFYGIPAVCMPFLFVMLLRLRGARLTRPRDWPDDLRLLFVLLLAGCGWWCVMMQHTSVHAHVMRHALSGYALLVAIVLIECARVLRDGRGAVRATAACIAIAVTYAHVEGTAANIRMHVESNYFDSRGRNDANGDFMRLLGRLPDVVPQGGVILTNVNSLPLMRVWTQRPVYLASSAKLPIDDPVHARWILELCINHLRELYHEKLPPLYYFYEAPGGDIRTAFMANHILRFFLLGEPGGGEDAWRRAQPIIDEAIASGSSSHSFCPIIASYYGRFLCFRLDSAVPILVEQFSPEGFPDQRAFGPIP